MRGRFCTQPFLVEKQTRYPLSPRRFPSLAPLGESIAPSSAPVCALGHLWFMVASPGPDRTVPRTVRPPRGRLWRLSFAKMLASIFFSENASQIGLSIPEGIAPQTDQRQRSPNPASGNERPSKPGVQGRSPGPLSPHFSGEMGTPAGQAGQRGAAPQSWEQPRPPKGYAVPSPAVVGRKPHVAGLCRQTSKSPPANLGRGAKDLSGPLPWR